MNYTQAQIDRANAVSLEDFLRSQGEQLISSRLTGRTLSVWKIFSVRKASSL